MLTAVFAAALIFMVACGQYIQGADIQAADVQGCALTNIPETENIGRFTNVTSQQAGELLLQADIIIADVRTQGEMNETGYIGQPLLLPHNEIRELAPSVIPDKNATILVYCRAGNRSRYAAEVLAELGYTAVYNLEYGILNWRGRINDSFRNRSFYHNFGDPPPEPTLFTFEVSQAVYPGSGEFTFVIEGYEIPLHLRHLRYPPAYFRLTYRIHSLTVIDPQGVTIQEFAVEAYQHWSTALTWFGLSFDDWNGDGYMDMSLRYYVGDSMPFFPDQGIAFNPVYVWLWDSEAGEFALSECLWDISSRSRIHLDRETGWVAGVVNIFAGERWVSYFEYADGYFVLVRE